jgi:hypothetical protein
MNNLSIRLHAATAMSVLAYDISRKYVVPCVLGTNNSKLMIIIYFRALETAQSKWTLTDIIEQGPSSEINRR